MAQITARGRGKWLKGISGARRLEQSPIQDSDDFRGGARMPNAGPSKWSATA